MPAPKLDNTQNSTGPKRASTQCLMSQFPTHPNREFFGALQGIKSGDQGNFFPHQGIRSRPLFGICFDDKCDRPDRPRLCREGEEGAADARSRRSRSRARSRFCPCEGAPGIPGNLAAKFVDANKRLFGLPYVGVGPVARCQTHQLDPTCGPEPPLDMLMTPQGVYEKSLGTLSPSPRRSPTG